MADVEKGNLQGMQRQFWVQRRGSCHKLCLALPLLLCEAQPPALFPPLLEGVLALARIPIITRASFFAEVMTEWEP